MTILLSCQSLSKSYNSRNLFRDISTGVSDGDRLGMIGPNGAGKSTFLKILAGIETPDNGVVSLKKGTRLGYVPQEDVLHPEMTVEEVLLSALKRMDEHDSAVQVEIMLGKGGFARRDQKVGALSGGWRKRLAIARELIHAPDLVLMDEPTNHLDLDGIFWLEKLLQNASFAYLLVSHDRYFLANVTNRVMELNRAYADGYFTVEGSYTDFLLRREEYLSGQAHQEVALASKVRREVEWLKRGPQGRQTKAQFRIRDAGRMIGELAELKTRNSQDRAVEIGFDASGRKSKELLVAKDVEKSLGGQVLFRKLSLVLSPGTKIGLIGGNGSGKTTLIRLLSGELAPDAGTVKPAETLRIVSFDQDREQLNREESLRTALAGDNETVLYRGSPIHVSSWAKRFLFHSEQLPVAVGSLSGGEQARILIARLMLQPADLLILDEPTNDLDIPSLEVLEESLVDFPGAIILVTHDRYMLDRISTEILALDGKGTARFFADYAQWEQSRATLEKPAKAAPRPTAPRSSSTQPAAPARGLSAREQREVDQMETRITAAEQDVAARMSQMEDPIVLADHLRLKEYSQELQSAQERVDKLYARWEELEVRRSLG